MLVRCQNPGCPNEFEARSNKSYCSGRCRAESSRQRNGVTSQASEMAQLDLQSRSLWTALGQCRRRPVMGRVASSRSGSTTVS
jgi:hypothetical protein